MGWIVTRWRLGILPKYLIILAFSFELTIVTYGLLVRRWNVMRFLFGLRPIEQEPAGPDTGSEGAAA